MTSTTLAQSYLVKATKRLKVLPVLMAEQAFSDVVREAQEIVELALKGMLRQVGIEPPKWHDVGQMLEQHRDRFRPEVGQHMARLTEASRWLRKEREFSFYGDVDFIPTDQYKDADGRRAVADAEFVVGVARTVIDPAARG